MICHEFFIIFLAFYVAFCASPPSPIRVAETDPSRCRPSRRPRPRLWTMVVHERGCFTAAFGARCIHSGT